MLWGLILTPFTVQGLSGGWGDGGGWDPSCLFQLLWPQVFLGWWTHLSDFSVVTCLSLCLFCVESPTASLLQRYRCRQLGPHQDEGHLAETLFHIRSQLQVPGRRTGSLGPVISPTTRSWAWSPPCCYWPKILKPPPNHLGLGFLSMKQGRDFEEGVGLSRCPRTCARRVHIPHCGTCTPSGRGVLGGQMR